jgi:acyl-coenzyme A thioesterase PaaI-like protein
MLKSVQLSSTLSKVSLFTSILVGCAVVISFSVIENTRPAYQAKITGMCPNGTQVKYITPSGELVCDGSVPANAVGPEQIQPNAVELRNMQNCSVDGGVGNTICPGSIVIDSVNSQQIQARITGTCNGGAHVESINDLGGVVCSTTVAHDTVGSDQIIQKSIIGFEHIQNHSVTETELSIDYAKAVPNGVASLDSSGKVPASQLPPLVSFTNVTVCDNITCCPRNQPGDVCVLPNVTYIYDGTELKVISSTQVTSVNGQIGAVNLISDQVTEGSTNLYLKTNSVGNTQMQANSINSANIIDMSIGTNDLSNGLITIEKMANASVSGGVGGIIQDGTIVSADVNSNSIQLRVTGICAGGGYITAVNSAGGVTCNFNAANHIAITNGNPHGTFLSQLGDTTVLGPTEGQVLTYTAGAWRNAAPSGGGGGSPPTTFLSELTGDVALSRNLWNGDILVYNQDVKFWQNRKRYIAQCGFAKKKKRLYTFIECSEIERGVYRIRFPLSYEVSEYYNVILTMGESKKFAYVDEANKAQDSVIINVFDLAGDPASGKVTVLIN